MNDITQSTASGVTPLKSLRNLTGIVYGLYAASVFVGLTAIVAIIINYIKRDEARGTVYESHFTWQIRTFWWGLLWSVIGVATVWLLIGFVVMGVTWIWLIYRIVRGFMNWNDGKAMPV
jgi:uncharacterized membrane protein